MIAQVRPLRPQYTTALRHLWGIVLPGPEGRQRRTKPTQPGTVPDLFRRAGGPGSLERPLERAARVIAPAQLVTVVTRDILLPVPDEGATLPGRRCVQPSARGTAPEIFLATLGVLKRDAHAIVAALPADHLIGHGVRLMHYVARAAAAVAVRPDLAVVVGAYCHSPDPEYAWVEPGDPVDGLEAFGVRAVRNFVTSPSVAERAAGFLGTLAVVISGATLVALGRRYLPDVIDCLEPLEDVIGHPEEALLCDAVWESMPHASICGDLLAAVDHLGVVSMPDAMTGEWARPAARALAS